MKPNLDALMITCNQDLNDKMVGENSSKGTEIEKKQTPVKIEISYRNINVTSYT